MSLLPVVSSAARLYPPGCNERNWYACYSTGSAINECPAFDNTISWTNYLAGVKNGKAYSSYPMASVVFKYSLEAEKYYIDKHFKFSDIRPAIAIFPGINIGNVRADKCYTLQYRNKASNPPHGYLSQINMMLNSDHPNFSLLHAKEGLPGNPLDGEINVDGVLLKFNEAGEVLNLDGVRVGQLQCYLQVDCSMYAIQSDQVRTLGGH
jgi:hypothetical protein